MDAATGMDIRANCKVNTRQIRFMFSPICLTRTRADRFMRRYAQARVITQTRRASQKKAYLDALEAASAEQNILPFAVFFMVNR